MATHDWLGSLPQLLLALPSADNKTFWTRQTDSRVNLRQQLTASEKRQERRQEDTQGLSQQRAKHNGT
jgi:hypothetical protein